MIFVTGDTHRHTDSGKLSDFADGHTGLTKDDYMIIAGDFGAVWSEKTLEKDLKPYSDLPFTVLFVDGNHENFDLLNSFPVETWHGGKVHKVRPDIIHLMRGQIFEIEDKTFFTFGGATSSDRDYRIANGYPWWEQEKPTYAEFEEGKANLKKHGNRVDYIVTHSCSERALLCPPLITRKSKRQVYLENRLLSDFEDTVEYGHWYFGHYHLDGDLNDKLTVLYREIRKI